MKKEFKLSEKRKELIRRLTKLNYTTAQIDYIMCEVMFDDKEFIRRLKEQIPKVAENEDTMECWHQHLIIDNLAGVGFK